tara:strand:+ start:2596 stop:2997 length:402 start_codon:yes stop_codon:yes gene_type:complete
MKHLFTVLLLALTTTAFSQAADADVTARHTTIYEWNNEAEEYLETDKFWLTSLFEIREDFLAVKIEGSEEWSIMWWAFNNFDEENDFYIYYTEKENKVILTGSDIYMFDKYNDSTNRYQKVVFFNKTSVSSPH